jgi:gluconate 5-dehydrogenase
MNLPLFDLTGKVALITGGTHGLGMSIAKGLASAGARIVINGHSPDRMNKAIDIYNESDYQAFPYLFDVSDEKQVIDGVTRITEEVGPIDILVNNAGIIKHVPLEEMEVSDFKQVLDIDLVSPFIVAKHIVKVMKRRMSGKIINICSMMSELGRDSVGAYAAAKGGLKMLTKNMATEWARYNIQVNGIGPGYFATEQTVLIRESIHPMNKFIINRTPAGKWGDPDDLAGAAIFLASKASDFVNGHILYVDGGILATIGKPFDES